MSDGINIVFDDTAVIVRLQQIARQVGNMAPAMRAIGEILSESTKERFATSTAPDGSQWKPNAPATILAMLAKISGNYAAYTNLKTRKEGRVRVGDKKGYFDKTGKVTQKTAQRLAAKKPLVDTGALADSIRYQVGSDDNSVAIGTNRFAGEWSGGAAVHQFGSKDGRIKPRPFLGISEVDRGEVLAILDRFMQQAVGRN